jgi:hypothetical protein
VSTPHRQSACTGGGGKEGGRKREGEKERKSTEGEGTLAGMQGTLGDYFCGF